MTSLQMGQLVNGVIPFLGGIYAALLGFRVLGKKNGVNERYDEWHRKYAKFLKVLGPILSLWGLLEVLRVWI